MNVAAFPLTIKALSPAGSIEGLAAAFGNVDLAKDRIIPGAFAKSIAGRDHPLPMLLHHHFDRPIGRWDSLQETPDGLIAKGQITLEVTDGREAYALARDGALTGLSIGYQVVKSAPGKGARDLLELALHEVSLVAIPANPRARISGIKSIAGARDIEELLTDAGMSGRKAKAAAAAAWRAIHDQDDDTGAEAKLAELLTTATAGLARYHGGTK